MASRYGLTIISPSNYIPGTALTEVDIVLVHGLNGDCFATWTAKTVTPPCFWPRDILPALCPNARVMTFGYNANLLKDTINGRIAEFAENLLADLGAERANHETDQQRPIIFICHSMGGIVVKRALLVAHSRPDYNTLFDATRSIIFMATPHRGSDKASWGSLAKNLLDCSKIFTTTKSLEELKRFSEVLEVYNNDFVNISSKIQVISFFEMKRYGSIGIIVDKWSARMDTHNETARIAVSADHRTICRFENENSPEFQTFWRQLRLLIHRATSEGSYQIGETYLNAARPVYRTDESMGSGQSKKRPQSQLEYNEQSLEEEINNLVIGQNSPRPSDSTILWRVPHFTSHRYFDRQDALDKLKRALMDERHRSFGIYGLGGVGKTQLALKYVHSYAHMYSHVFWVVADTDLKLKTSFREMAIEMGKLPESVSDLEKARRAMQEWFSETHNWLLILDNVEVTPKILKEYFPSSSMGFLVITSRTPFLVEQHVLSDGLRLRPFGEAEGAEFFLSHDMGLEDSPRVQQLAKHISSELGGHPLGLSTMAGYINCTQISLEDFLRDFHRDRDAYISTSFDEALQEASFDYERSLSTCWTISLEPLYGKPAGDLLGILALLDPDTITEDILTNYAEEVSRSSIPSLHSLAKYRELYMHLRRHALIDKEPPATASTSTQPLLSIHRLVQQAWLSSLAAKGALWEVFDHAVHCISSVYPHRVNGESMQEAFPLCLVLTPHIMSLYSHYESFFPFNNEVRPDNLPRETELFVQLLADAGWFLYETGQWETAKKLFFTAKELCHLYFAADPHRLTALIYNNIAVIYDSMYKPEESIRYVRMSLAIREKCLPPDDPEMGNSYTNLGHGLGDTGRYEEAQSYYLRAVEVHERAQKPSNDLLEGAYASTGRSMLYLNRLQEAESWLNKATNQHKYFRTPNHFVALTLLTVASLRMKQNRWTEAETAVRKSLEIWIRTKGPSARLVGVGQHHLAFIRHQQGSKEEAIDLLRKAISVFRVPSETQPGLLQRSLLKLASILDELEEGGSLEASKIRDEVREHCLRDPIIRNIPFDSEKEWNNVIQVAYRCI